jgi:hypothetical protein
LDEIPVVAKHVEQRRPKSVSDLLNPIPVPSGNIERIRGRIKPAQVRFVVESRLQLGTPLASLEQLLQLREHRITPVRLTQRSSAAGAD